jgi:hypothetical protein
MSKIVQRFIFKQQHNMRKRYKEKKNTSRRSTISRLVLEFSFFKFFSNGVLPLLSCLRSVFQSVERCLGRSGVKTFYLQSITAFKIQIHAPVVNNCGSKFWSQVEIELVEDEF